MTWLRDLGIGMRFAAAGGREGWARTALTAVGVGLGVACTGCIEAITPSLAKRGTSAGSMVSMCSMRWRRPRSGAGFDFAALS